MAGVMRGRIGFGGVLVSDDLAMQALTGHAGRAGEAAAGSGLRSGAVLPRRLAPTADLLAACPPLTGAAAARLQAARALAAGRRMALDGAALADERNRLLP